MNTFGVLNDSLMKKNIKAENKLISMNKLISIAEAYVEEVKHKNKILELQIECPNCKHKFQLKNTGE